MIPRGFALVLPVLALISVAPAGAGAAEPERLFRATARGTAIHAFYDHEGLFPVPILDVSVPYAEATFEPGPTSSALASFLWDPQAAELGTILCVLSEGGLCDVPEYPFQARASYPSSGSSEPPPTLTLDDEDAPIGVRAAHEEADADADGARGAADVAALRAIPMTPAQAAAARSLSAALAPFSSRRVAASRWLISVGEAVSRSDVRTGPDRVESTARSALHDVELLGGLVRIDVVRTRVTAEIGDEPDAGARAEIGGVEVTDLRARVTRDGIEIADAEIPAAALGALNDAVDAALERAAIDIRRGQEHVRIRDDAAHADAFALSLQTQRRLVPEDLPEGTQGRDVLKLRLGSASADAGVAQILPPPVSPPEPDPPPPAPLAPSVPQGVGAGVVGAPAPTVAPPLSTGSTLPEAEDAFVLSNMSIPRPAVIVVVAAAVLFALALTWLRVNEVLNE